MHVSRADLGLYYVKEPWTSHPPALSSRVLGLRVYHTTPNLRRAGDWTQGFMHIRKHSQLISDGLNKQWEELPGHLYHFFLFVKLFSIMYVSVSISAGMCLCMHTWVWVPSDQRHWISWNWSYRQLWVIPCWVAGNWTHVLSKSVSTLNCWSLL